MSAKSIREYDGKLLLAHWLLKSPAVFPDAAATSEGECFVPPAPRVASVNLEAVVGACAADAVGIALAQEFARLEALHPWLLTCKLVAKPDQLIKRRGKGGLLLLNASWKEVQRWIVERAGKDVTVDGVSGVLKAFIVEPFVPHGADTEHYVCIHSERNEDTILFTHEGGIDVGDVDAKADRITVPVTGPFPSDEKLRAGLLRSISDVRKQRALADFIKRLYNVYVDLHFTYLEINPLVVLEPVSQDDLPRVVYLDLAAKLDQTAEFESGPKWAIARCLSAAFQASNSVDARTAASGAGAPMVDVGPPMEFPPPFGRDLTKEEAYIASLDAKTGASLKLTVLNKNGRIWTMVAGGGASVVYSDAIAALGYAHELANYGEYSGAPSETQTYEYAKTILDLMTRSPTPHPDGKVLLIGGGIANFTNVAATFKGIVRALKQYQRPLQAHNVQVYVRRGGPNYQEGLSLMRQLGESMGVPIHVFGPETHVTAIVPLALAPFSQAKANGSLAAEQERITADLDIVSKPKLSPVANGSPAANGSPVANGGSAGEANGSMAYFPSENGFAKAHPWYAPFTENTRALVYGMQPRAVQGMLDFDFICKRKTPSVAAMIYPFGGAHVQKFYWGTQETLLPVFTTIDDALAKFPEVDCVVNFASCRSVYESTMEMLAHGDKIRSIAIIAEGVPERRARQIIAAAKAKGVLIIGPATVGGIKPGCFKVGNTGGMMDNIVSSKLYRPGSVAYVSKSGGMSNELNNIICRTTNGVYEGVAIGGDRYPGSTFIDHLLRFEQDPNVRMLVLLGEVGGVEEYAVAAAVREGRITKPVVAWCIGTCASMFTTAVQFGHAGSMAQSNLETADAKNAALKAAGVVVPATFEELPEVLQQVFNRLVSAADVVLQPEPEVPKIPIDYAWAQELGLVRKPASFVSTICDDRGQELLYAGMRISDVFKEDIGIGGVLSLLWFKRRLPDYACRFIEMVLMLTADHGPAVSGAMNTIITSRAGKDLVSSLCAGLLTIGERFGGALDGAASQFSQAYDSGRTPRQFVDDMRKKNKLILGIGHKIKSRTNPDLRVSIVKDYVRQHFPACPLLDYAEAVETITTSKKDNLILNVDGTIAVSFVDLLRYCGAFTLEEADEYIKIGSLNGLFVVGRSMGFIGHYIDQNRLKQGLYRHPWDDISYIVPTSMETGRTFVGASKVTGGM